MPNLTNIHCSDRFYDNSIDKSLRENTLQDLLEFDENQQKIIEQYNHILLQLSLALDDPLLQFIPKEMVIAGGAVRDLVLKKHDKIRDVDVLFFANLHSQDDHGYHTNEILEIIHSRCIKCGLLTQVDIEKKLYKDTEYFFILLKHVLPKYLTINESFSESTFKIEPLNKADTGYPTSGVSGVLKVNLPNIDFDIDLIFISNSCKEFIKHQFDYGICKTFYTLNYDYLSHIYKQEHNNKSSYISYPFVSSLSWNQNHAYKNGQFHFSEHFLQDVMDKKISFDVVDFDIDQTKRSLMMHLPKILKKYPNYKPMLIHTASDILSIKEAKEQEQEKDTIFNAVILEYNLSLALNKTDSNKEEYKIIKKNKI